MISRYLPSGYNELLDDKDSVVIDFYGPLTIETITELGQTIKSIEYLNSGMKSKVFKSFIELAQNIANYSIERQFINRKHNVGIGSLLLLNHMEKFTLIATNKIFNHHCNKIKGYFKEIDSLDINQIRILKKKTLKNSERNSLSPHIGLIYLSLISNKNIRCEFVKLNDSFSEINILMEF